jgi:hypothetical protein
LRIASEPIEARQEVKMAIAQFSQSSFAHRRNPDGTVDSICKHCFLTAAHAKEESDLQEAEEAHVCAPREPRTVLVVAKKR